MKRRALIISGSGPLALRTLPRALIVAPATAAHAQQPGGSDLEVLGSVIASWLDAKGLADKFDVQRASWVTSADDAARPWLQLELLFRAPAEEPQESAEKRFDDVVTTYGKQAQTELPAALFYRLVHAAGVPREQATVVFHVQRKDYRVALDDVRGTANMRAVLGQERFTFISPVDLIAKGTTPERIQRILEAHFKQVAAQAGAAIPKIDSKPLGQQYAGIEVRGLRRQVFPDKNYWEFLQLSIELHPVRGDLLPAACYLDGKLAPAGWSDKPPPVESYRHDMQLSHPGELNRYGGNLLSKLQAELQRGQR